jgi:hypothetical protein
VIVPTVLQTVRRIITADDPATVGPIVSMTARPLPLPTISPCWYDAAGDSRPEGSCAGVWPDRRGVGRSISLRIGRFCEAVIGLMECRPTLDAQWGDGSYRVRIA